MVRSLTALAAFIVLILSPFTAAEDKGNAIDAAKLVGTWQYTIGSGDTKSTQTLTLEKAGTYKYESKGIINRTYSGTWAVTGNQLVQTIKESSDKDMNRDDNKMIIKSVSDKELILQLDPEDPQETAKFQRVNS